MNAKIIKNGDEAVAEFKGYSLKLLKTVRGWSCNQLVLNGATEVTIPSEVTDGINTFTIKGIIRLADDVKYEVLPHLKKITIQPTIKVWAYGLRYLNVDVLEMPSDIKEIRDGTFMESTIGEITGLESVEEVGICAFASTTIGKLTWPSGCKEIPNSCFSDARIDELRGIEAVTSIGDAAFACSSVKLKDAAWDWFVSAGTSSFFKADDTVLPYFVSSEDRAVESGEAYGGILA